jgi:hypothetical protein
MFRKSQNYTDPDQPSETGQRSRIARLVTLLSGVVFVAAAAVAGLLVLRLTDGVSRSVDAPRHMVRLQVLNTTSVRDAATKLTKQLSDYADSEIEVKVVDTGRFDIRRVSASFIVARQEDRTAAVLLARRIGLDPKAVIYQPLDHNYRQISATLVIGEDYRMLRLSPLTS